MPCNCDNIDKAAICNAARQLLRQRFAELVQNVPCSHTNADGNYSPAQYWFDRAMTQRCTVGSGMSLSLRGTTILIFISVG